MTERVRRTASGLAFIDGYEACSEWRPTAARGSMILRPREFDAQEVPFDAEGFVFRERSHTTITYAFRTLEHATSMLCDIFVTVCEMDDRPMTLKIFLIHGMAAVWRLAIRKHGDCHSDGELRFDISFERFAGGSWQLDRPVCERIEKTWAVTSVFGFVDTYQDCNDGFAVIQFSRG